MRQWPEQLPISKSGLYGCSPDPKVVAITFLTGFVYPFKSIFVNEMPIEEIIGLCMRLTLSPANLYDILLKGNIWHIQSSHWLRLVVLLHSKVRLSHIYSSFRLLLAWNRPLGWDNIASQPLQHRYDWWMHHLLKAEHIYRNFLNFYQWLYSLVCSEFYSNELIRDAGDKFFSLYTSFS